MTRYEYKVLDTGKNLELELNALGKDGWKVVGVTTKKQLVIAPPQAVILIREIERAERERHTGDELVAAR